MTRCDVVVTTGQEVYINGTRIGNVMDIEFRQDSLDLPRLSIEVHPTSVIFGQVPNDTVEALAADQHPDSTDVDISRAISRAQARKAGLDPNAHTIPAKPSAARSLPSAVADKPSRSTKKHTAEEAGW